MTDKNSSARLAKVLEIYGAGTIAGQLQQISPARGRRNGYSNCAVAMGLWKLTEAEYGHLQRLLPQAPPRGSQYDCDFIDLFASIGGMCRGFEHASGRCDLTSEWNPFTVRTSPAPPMRSTQWWKRKRCLPLRCNHITGAALVPPAAVTQSPPADVFIRNALFGQACTPL